MQSRSFRPRLSASHCGRAPFVARDLHPGRLSLRELILKPTDARPLRAHIPPRVRLASTLGAVETSAGTSGAQLQQRDLVPASHTDRVVGSLLGSMCGNVLAAPLEGDRHWRVASQHYDGVRDFLRHDLGSKVQGYGRYTVEFALQLATARSLVAAAGSSSSSVEAALADVDTTARRATPYTTLLVDALRGGADPASIPDSAATFITSTISPPAATSSDRYEREIWGPTDNTGVARIPPVALAYRHASPPQLAAAVAAALRCSHGGHDEGEDGAQVIAAAVAWVLTQPPPPSDAAGARTQVLGLLSHVRGVEMGPDMALKLALLSATYDVVGEMDGISSWALFLRSPAWQRVTSVLPHITRHGFATSGNEAAAVGLWAAMTSWRHPEQAVIMATMFGGTPAVNAQITGALMGALHGRAWLPSRWVNALENGTGGRDDVITTATALASLDCRSLAEVGGPEPIAEEVPL